MPTVHKEGPYRFFFYSDEGREPPHIHIERESKTAKFWLRTVYLARSSDFRPNELSRIEKLVSKNRSHLLEKWNKFFSKGA